MIAAEDQVSTTRLSRPRARHPRTQLREQLHSRGQRHPAGQLPFGHVRPFGVDFIKGQNCSVRLRRIEPLLQWIEFTTWLVAAVRSPTVWAARMPPGMVCRTGPHRLAA